MSIVTDHKWIKRKPTLGMVKCPKCGRPMYLFDLSSMGRWYGKCGSCHKWFFLFYELKLVPLYE